MEENKTLLIVDDEPETLKGYAEFLAPAIPQPVRRSSRTYSSISAPDSPNATPKLLNEEEYRLLLAPSGEEAVRLVQEELQQGRRIAGGFFDVKLGGGMDGLSTITEIRKLDSEIHCTIVTAYHDRTVDEIHGLFGDGFKDQWDYLNKPFTQGEIVQKARQMVAAWNRKRKIEEMNRQLVRSERMAAIGQVARGIGHEFGNILTRIIGKTDLALMEMKDLPKIHDHLRVIMAASERAAIIVRNLHSFSKAEPMLIDATVAEAVEEAVSFMTHELMRSEVQLEKRIHPTPVFRLDVGAMAQVFLNLMINAVHAMPDGGTLTVEVKEERGKGGQPGVAVSVEDSGFGIPPEVLSRIFDYAFTTKGDRGSGIGLSISREIIEAHGGTIQVHSVVGKGTRFSVWLPSK